MSAHGWVAACAADDIVPEDVVRFDHGGRTFAIYRSSKTDILRPTGSARTSRCISPTVT
jgi:hypothetical protein